MIAAKLDCGLVALKGNSYYKLIKIDKRDSYMADWLRVIGVNHYLFGNNKESYARCEVIVAVALFKEIMSRKKIVAGPPDNHL